MPDVARKLRNSPRAESLVVTGGDSRGDPCEAFAYHGFNGMEAAVVQKVAAWITGR